MAPLSAQTLAAAIAVAAAATSAGAFVVPSSSSSSSSRSIVGASGRVSAVSGGGAFVPRRLTMALFAEEEEVAAAAAAEAEAEEPAAEGEDAEASEAAAEEEEEEEEEDPEVTELKARISELEGTLKKKRTEKDEVQNAAENYSELGYTRKVAEMDQIRKLRGLAFKSNEFTAKANVVQKFLPVLDELTTLDDRYSDDEFAKSYAALRGTFVSSLSSLGMTEYTVEVGAALDVRRMEVEREEYSDDYAEGTVMAPVAVGMEIEGNVMRMAKVVGSLGSEEEAMKKAEEEAAAAAAAAAEAEAEAAEGGEEEPSE